MGRQNHVRVTLKAGALCLALLGAWIVCAGAVELQWRNLRKGDFVVHYTRLTPRTEVNELLGICETARARVKKYFIRKVHARMEIAVYPDTGDFTAATGKPAWLSAIYMDGLLFLQPPHILKENGTLTSTIVHEYAHLALEEAAGKGVPLWFHEGFATYVSREFKAQYKKDKEAFHWDGTLEQLHEALTQTDDEEKAEHAYRVCYSMVRSLYVKYKVDKMADFLDAVRYSHDFEFTMQNELGTDANAVLAASNKKTTPSTTKKRGEEASTPNP